MSGARRLVVLRHGETEHNAAGIWQGHYDSALSERGHEQVRTAAAALSQRAADEGPLRLTRVVASDLRRAAQTGQDVADACGIPISFDERWREIHVGAWTGLTATQVREQYPEDQDRLLSGEDFKRGGDGESVADVVERIRPALAELLADLRSGEAAVVATHGVTGRVLVAELVGIDQQLAWLALGGLGNCHWAELEEASRGWRIRTWNAPG